MSFFDGLGRFLQGKPVFEDPNADKETGTNPENQSQPVDTSPKIDKADHNTFPVVRIERVKSHINGDHLHVYGEVKNEWPEEIMLDKIHLLGTVRELDTSLRGHEEKDLLLYDGPRPKQQYYEAELDYKTQKEGDYFQSIHDVGVEYDGNDKSYSVDELSLRPPIRDIYG